VTYPSDLYTLEDRQRDAMEKKKRRISEGGGTGDGEGGAPVLLSELRGWGPVSIQKLYKAIDQSRQSLSCAR
jgi:NAD-dependent DNA ligase